MKNKHKVENTKLNFNEISNDFKIDDIKFKLEEIKYENMLNNDINTCNFNTDIYKKVAYTIIYTILLGAFYTWCSASDTSNYVKLINNKIIINIIYNLPWILEIIFTWSIYITAINIKRKINVQYLGVDSEQTKIITKFILKQMNFEYKDFYDKSKKLEEYCGKYSDGVLFDFCDFSTYVKDIIKPYMKNINFSFGDHLIKVILYKQVVKKMLILKSDGRCIFNVKDNQDFKLYALLVE